MFRKLILAIAATTALGAVALAPTTASAHWHGHWGHGHGYGFGFYGPTYVAGPDCYVTKRLVETPYGMRWRRITVCD
jgi:hypothetical protein